MRGDCTGVVAVVPHSQGFLAMDLKMFPERRRMCVGFITTSDSAVVWLVRGVHVHVLLPVAGVGEPSVTSFYFTFKWFFTCMNSFVDLEIFRSCKKAPASGVRTGERFFPRMHSHMIHKLVLGFEAFLFSGALLPVAGMVGVLWSPHMVHRQVVHNVVEGVEHLVAQLFSLRVLPHAHHVLLDRLWHVAVVGGHVVLAVQVAVVVAGGLHAPQCEGVSCCCCCVEWGAEHGVVGGVRQEVPGVGRHWRGVI